MENYYGKLLFIIIFSAIAMLGPDTVSIAQHTWKAHELTEYATEKMSAGGGWTSNVQSLVQAKMNDLHINPDNWSIKHTDGVVKGYGDVYFSMETKYAVRAYAMLGKPVVESLGDATLVRISSVSTMGTEIY